MELPEGPFDVIYADPPWAYRKTPLVNRGSARAVEKEYGTMQPSEIAELPIGRLANKNAILLMWVTSPKLAIGLDVMRAWGFNYKTMAFCWVKHTKHGKLHWGQGFYTRSNVEVCLLGTKGKGIPRQSASVHQVVEDAIMEHSKKPETVRQRIDQLYPHASKLEIFARTRADGWSSWGNQVPSEVK